MTSQSYENYGEVPHLLLIITLLFVTFVKDFKLKETAALI